LTHGARNREVEVAFEVIDRLVPNEIDVEAILFPLEVDAERSDELVSLFSRAEVESVPVHDGAAA